MYLLLRSDNRAEARYNLRRTEGMDRTLRVVRTGRRSTHRHDVQTRRRSHDALACCRDQGWIQVCQASRSPRNQRCLTLPINGMVGSALSILVVLLLRRLCFDGGRRACDQDTQCGGFHVEIDYIGRWYGQSFSRICSGLRELLALEIVAEHVGAIRFVPLLYQNSSEHVGVFRASNGRKTGGRSHGDRSRRSGAALC